MVKKKVKNAEKVKVKLKGHTTKFLPKGLNITKTEFRVRKIVVPDQLKTPDASQPLTKRKLNVHEVLSKFTHYNTSQRQEGLDGLRELLCQMNSAQLTSHLSVILGGLGRLCLDEEQSVRKSSARIFALLLSLVSEKQLYPFRHALGSYLTCAMTHIKTVVQEDSLLIFDALLEHTPAMAAASASKLLPCVLDMISRSRGNHGASRELTLHLSSNLVSSTWRAKVFGRLQALLVVSLKHRKDTSNSSHKTANSAPYSFQPVTSNSGKPPRFPVYNSTYVDPVCLDRIFHRSITSCSKELLYDNEQLCTFVESIMPLMLDSWMEVTPVSSERGAGLPLQSAIILHCVLEIIDLLWEHVVLWDAENGREELTPWFRKTFSRDIAKYLGEGFPYRARSVISVEDDLEKSQGRGRVSSKTNKKDDTDMATLKLALPYLLRDKDEASSANAISKCVLQNLTMCHLLANISSVPPVEVIEKILGNLASYLKQWSGDLLPWSDHLLRTLRSVFEKSCSWDHSIDLLLSAVVSRYQQSSDKKSASHQHLSSQLCDLLGEVAVHPKFQHLQRYESFHKWIVQFPSSLESGKVTLNKLRIFNKLACLNNTAFLEGLHLSFQALLHAVSTFQVEEGEGCVEKEVALASLFFWIRDWDTNQVNALRNVLVMSNKSSLAKKILNILCVRKETLEILHNDE